MPADWTVLVGDNRQTLATIAPQSVDCCVTSPPYYGLRKYGEDSAEIGREQTPEQYLAALVEVFRLVRAALKPSGSVWVNLGDSYCSTDKWGGGGENTGKHTIEWSGGRSDCEHHLRINKDEWFPNRPDFRYCDKCGAIATCHSWAVRDRKESISVAPGNLLGIPWRFALAMQADGWTLRSEIIWAKGMSFLSHYSGSCMPQSQRGTRWERCRIKLKSKTLGTNKKSHNGNRSAVGGEWIGGTEWQDCPGCPKCSKHGGLVLRRGQWRPTTGHEYVFLFTLGEAVLDCESVRERPVKPSGRPRQSGQGKRVEVQRSMTASTLGSNIAPSVRNLRTVWAINPEANKERHYAMYPRKLVRPIVTVATSARGCCPVCGAPWARVVATEQLTRQRPNKFTKRTHEDGTGNTLPNDHGGVETRTLGFRPTCDCGREDVAPAVVLDPFHGGGTTGIVCDELSEGYGCKDGPRPIRYIGCELHEKYLSIGEARRSRFAAMRVEATKRKPKKVERRECGIKQRQLFGDSE